MPNEFSYVQGSSDPGLITSTIGEYLGRIAIRYNRQEALISRHQGIRYTYGELHTEIECAARGLLALGVQPGERIGIWAANCAEWLVTQYASARIGAILVSVNPAYRIQEVDHVLRDAGVAVLIAAQDFRHVDSREMLRRLAPELTPSGQALRSDRFPLLRSIVSLGPAREHAGFTWADLMARHLETPEPLLREREAMVRFDEPVSIVYTSGTSGMPKGVVHSHRTLLNCGFIIGERLRYGADDRICLPVPLYHVFGGALGSLAAMTHASALVLPSDVFDPLQCLHTIQAERCTVLYGVPTMFIAQLEHPALAYCRLDSLRTGIMAGAPCPIELMRRVIERMHIPELSVSYGMTECLAALHTSLDDTFERRVATVGTTLPHVECKIIDPQHGGVVPRGAPGELCTRSYGLMLGYWNDAPGTAAAIDTDGWMHTGDLALIDDRGYVTIIGRLKDMIIRAGENVYPREVEDFLHTHPKVCDVHVIGVEDPEYGEEVCAWIKLREKEKATAEEIRRYCRNQIADYKIPRHIRFVDEFPRTATGKVQKFRMREITLAEGDVEILPKGSTEVRPRDEKPVSG
jgi:fatty-acyl-CoA synthase